MGRRKKIHVNKFENGSRVSIGDAHVDVACTKLNVTAARECALYLDHFEGGNILNWFFEEEVLRRLRLVKDLIPIAYSNEDYVLIPGVRINIDFKRLAVPTILPVSYRPDLTKCQPIIEAAKKALEIHRKYARVKHMLRWFNRNATPGAIRAYWPAALALCPNSVSMQALMDAAPARYDTPRDIGTLLPLIRETASTVAAMELIPADAEPRTRSNVWLALDAADDEFEGVSYGVEALTINV
jgi:hypothetical protein